MPSPISDKKLKELLYPHGRGKDIYRIISYPIVKLILPWNIHPDGIHLFRLLYCLAGTALFFTGDMILAVIGAILFQLNILFDTFDGALARYQNRASIRGEYQDVFLDHLCSSILYFASVAGFGYALTLDTTYFWVGLVTVLLAQVAAFLRAMYIEYNIKHDAANATAMVRFAHQDNSRLLALVLLLAALLVMPAVAAGLFLLLVVAKILILAVHIFAQSGKNPLNLWVLVRYVVVVLIIVLWLAQKILGINTSRTRKSMSSSKRRSVIEKQIVARLD